MALDTVAIAGIGETEKSRGNPDDVEEFQSLEQYYARAAKLTLEDAGLSKDDVDGFGMVNPAIETPYIYPSMVTEMLGFTDLEWMNSVDNGGSSAVSLLLQSALAIEAGVVDTVLCIGADVPRNPHREESIAFPEDPRGTEKNYLLPLGTQGPNSRLAHVQNAHMDKFGTRPEQLGEISVVQRLHASLNPLAHFDEGIDLDDYLESAMISDPIRLLDCVIPVNGGFGFLLTNQEVAEETDGPSVSIEGIGECHTYDGPSEDDLTTTGVESASRKAYDMAGVGPEDMDFLQLYDDYPIIVTMQLEDLGFCEKGDGGEFVKETDLRYDGELPLNTSGGQLSSGQVGLAGGFTQLIEGIRQLRGDGGERQVPNAELGLVSGVGGIAYGKNLRNNNIAILSGESA